jgi:hypothetical protein
VTGCCGGRGDGLSVADCMDAGLRNRRLPPLAVRGEPLASADGLQACFSLQRKGGAASELRFQCTSCTTLVAYCEALRRLCTGLPLERVARFRAADLVTALPGVPAVRQNRAALAVGALRAAVVAAGVPVANEEEIRE